MLRHLGVLGMVCGLAGCTEQVTLNDLPDGGTGDAWGTKDTAPATGPDGEGSCGLIPTSMYLRAEAAQLLIVLDRSAAMQAGFSGTTRQAAAESAIMAAITSYKSRVKFGFEQFPPDSYDHAYSDCQRNSCCAGSVRAEPQVYADDSISPLLDCGDGSWAFPCPVASSDTPSYAALKQVRDYYKSNPSGTDDQYVLLVTAAEPSCSSLPGDEACNDALSAANDLGSLGVRVLVLSVGFQPGTGSCLVRISKTGSPLPVPGNVEPLTVAPNQNELAKALTDLASILAKTSCTLDSISPPPPSNVKPTVSIGSGTNEIPPADSPGQNGWAFTNATHSQITLYGSACEQFVNSPTSKVSAVYQCSTCSNSGANACPWLSGGGGGGSL